MQRPTIAGLTALLLFLVPPAVAQVPSADSGTAGGWVASFGRAPLLPPRNPALQPGGRLGPASTPALVAARWADQARARLPAPRIGVAAAADDSLNAAIAAARAALPPAGPVRAASPFGPYADLGLQLNLRMEIKADQFKNHRCGLLE